MIFILIFQNKLSFFRYGHQQATKWILRFGQCKILQLAAQIFLKERLETSVQYRPFKQQFGFPSSRFIITAFYMFFIPTLSFLEKRASCAVDAF